MAFASWYSIHQNLPDAVVAVYARRQNMIAGLFSWTKRCRVPFSYHSFHKPEDQAREHLKKYAAPLLIISPSILALRGIEEGGEYARFLETTPQARSAEMWLVNDLDAEFVEFTDAYCDAKEEKISSFTSYQNGWGKFVTSSWIDRVGCPFLNASRYATGPLTANEIRIGKLWGQMAPLYQTVARG